MDDGGSSAPQTSRLPSRLGLVCEDRGDSGEREPECVRDPEGLLAQASENAVMCAMAARFYDLTRREEEVLLLLLEGSSFATVAAKLFVSENTVKTHVRHIYRKMNVNSKQDLVKRIYGEPSSSPVA